MTHSSQRWLWITDPWETLDHSRDTTLRLIEEGLKLGIKQYWCDVKTIRLETEQVRLDAFPILNIQFNRQPGTHSNSHVNAQDATKAVTFGPLQVSRPEEFRQIHYRTDPPVDLAYLHPLELLALSGRRSKRIEFVNPLSSLFSFNEKIEASALSGLAPKSLVSSQKEVLTRFGKEEGRVVLKPLHQAQSLGVELLNWNGSDSVERAEKLIREASQNYTIPILLQKYLEGIQQGETRLWFLDAKPFAWIKKLPLKGDFRVNIDQGSSLAKTELTPQEKTQSVKISQHLKCWKVRLAAVDLIEGYVTDFNLTSPGLITQMEIVLGENLAKKIVQRLKSRLV